MSVLKPLSQSIFSGMADRGAGIRIFHSKEGLQEIFEEFEEESDKENEGDEDTEGASATSAVVTSQLRHFVIQVSLS